MRRSQWLIFKSERAHFHKHVFFAGESPICVYMCTILYTSARERYVKPFVHFAAAAEFVEPRNFASFDTARRASRSFFLHRTAAHTLRQ